MKNFEYKVDKVGGYDFKYNYNEDKYLREMGEKGWELVGVTIINSNDNYIDRVTYYFKREILP